MSSSESNVFDVRLNLRGKKGGGFREVIELMFEDDDITKRLFRIGMYRVVDVLKVNVRKLGMKGKCENWMIRTPL
ncbi:hypothetical protein RchiOBHm_Chr5g0046721 [Rosa chinensis]|uniref:Uncharacterized protein n=1 Tax=Rosa chinensis TaxID=74649 RepID=A0A2P6QE54_ROSCH|nr:hypothetical protein RchiOBHm_Chr5g0046721 [Rosa chinensis]